ncbi:hypothetical protein BH20ACT13_BH20ACT13_10680 [soil metagenome]
MSETAAHALADYASLLAASRRIDWRFLLPHPELGHVACSTAADPALVHSCRLFAKSLTLLEEQQDERAPRSVDLLVLVDPQADELSSALDLLKPGGWMYVEIHGALTRRGRRLRRLRFPADHIAELRRLGLDRIEAYWHWPDFESCTEIMPLGEPAAMRGALLRRQASRGRSVLVSVARLLLATRLLPLAVTHGSVIGQRPAGESVWR